MNPAGSLLKDATHRVLRKSALAYGLEHEGFIPVRMKNNANIHIYPITTARR